MNTKTIISSIALGLAAGLVLIGTTRAGDAGPVPTPREAVVAADSPAAPVAPLPPLPPLPPREPRSPDSPDSPRSESPGCTTNAECTADEFCDKEDADCAGFGTCVTRPQNCITVFDPVCGCDGQTYSNSCVARQNGVNVAAPGPC